ncbi:hypothetical protein BN7_3048 [Wickerhamomyces ciferrii]|uniref:Flavin reductase like domain-containing protein n=1 Tax=Wickerhamomyces ciferrii (strain ATCC 14091 / BCRC 22168 / CBS 111 / JCM 3599 / NBRC 0793 / NRRL Y-1031 F-60-10) TaxID=1206466 RepID=K0KQG4_WICCF|nr:uncharacterized protein BN7_3048 [Wickerhamomyces ciferrii]CCH43498.1 hypothetical protein BN7_3048 [Wickerhamomyces ciferrii]
MYLIRSSWRPFRSRAVFIISTKSTSTMSQNQQVRKPFNELEAERKEFDDQSKFELTKSPNPNWNYKEQIKVQGVNHEKIEINPSDSNRSPVDNYKLLISAVIPRPIGFISTISSNGTRNLAPFSYFTMVNHDPPIFVVGFSSKKDSYQNLLDTKECTINIISEWFVEAANSCSIDGPSEFDEWELSGLTSSPSLYVKPGVVDESAFAIEAKLVKNFDWFSKKDPTKKTGSTVFLEGINFHVRKDIINTDLNQVDVSKLKPVSRLGGITYGRTTQGYEKPRPKYSDLDNEK